MRIRSLWTVLLASLGLLAGVARLLDLRLERGDVYAEFSSLRSDPMGSRAFYESLGRLPGLSVERNFRPVARLGGCSDCAVLFLGVDVSDLAFLDTRSVASLELLVRSGARVILTLVPGDVSNAPASPTPRGQQSRPTRERRPGRVRPTPGPQEEEENTFVSLPERWGFETALQSAARSGATARLSDPGLPLKTAIPWHGAASLRGLVPAWRSVYVRDNVFPVVIERSLGKGTIVICSDSSFVSNLTLLRQREPALLAWLIEGKRRIVFDETHLGVSESTGLAALARRYRLHGLAAGVLGLALLFVWSNAVPFAPTPAGAQRSSVESIAGRQAFEGLAAVLRRNIPPSRLLATCAEQWKKTLPRQGAGLEEQTAAIDAIVRRESKTPIRQRDILSAYRQASAAAARKKQA